MIERLTAKRRAELDAMDLDEVRDEYGDGRLVTIYAEGAGYWAPGTGKPNLAPDDPAEAQAIGRCLASRVRSETADFAFIRTDEIHPRQCGWCDFPKADMLRACDYATWASRFVVSEYLSWAARSGGDYTRSTNRSGEYDNPAWAAFFQGATPAGELMPPSDREFARSRRRAAIAEAAGYV